MELVPYVVAYVGLGIFLVAVVARFFLWTRMPMHVRWELYPVAHEAKRAHYGGSYLEETDWWKKPRQKSLLGELKVMVPEILFLVALKEHNPKLWRVSFPFHFGLYLVIACTAAMIFTAGVCALWPSVAASGFGTLLRYAIMVLGYAGLGLSLMGALGLLARRLGDPGLKDFTAPADIFNLMFFVLAFGFALVHTAWLDRDFARTITFISGLLTFQMTALPGEPLQVIMASVSVCLLGALVGYIPLTHMSHFVGKYFAYHAIRWNDEPNLRGSPQEATIQRQLQYPVSWAAPHIQGGGKKSWADVATEEQHK